MELPSTKAKKTFLMNTVQKERELTLALKNRFDQARKFDRIYIFKRPFQSPRLKRKWNELYRPKNVTTDLVPPLQPEIDMILCKGKEMNAVEIKYFDMKGRSLSRSFYHGIEQSLALLRWGFDHVALWQMFDVSIPPPLLYYYGAWTWRFCRAEAKECGIRLPIDFTFIQPQKRGPQYDFPAFNVIIDKNTRAASLEQTRRPIHDPEFMIEFRHDNPLLSCPIAKDNREMLAEWLDGVGKTKP